MKTTLSNMLSMIEGPFQEKVSRDRPALVNYANRIRQMFYDLYQQYEMEVDATECFKVQKFGGCHCSYCPEPYWGITLPAHMNAVEAVWFNSEPLPLYSKWREAKVGIKPANDCLRASYDKPGTYPTERDINKEGGTRLMVFGSEVSDGGKQVEIIYKNPGNEEKRESLVLPRSGGVATTDLAVSIQSVVLPALDGTVTLKQECDGRVLSEYLPYERVPSYRRIKITGVCGNDQVLVRANRQYQPVFWDTDIVETDNQRAIINAAYHIFYAESGADAANLQKAEYHKAQMMEALRGEASRATAINRENDTGRFGPPVRKSRLWRFRGGHNIYRKR